MTEHPALEIEEATKAAVQNPRAGASRQRVNAKVERITKHGVGTAKTFELKARSAPSSKLPSSATQQEEHLTNHLAVKVARIIKDGVGTAKTFELKAKSAPGPKSLVAAGSSAAQQERHLANRLVAEIAADNPDVNALCETYGLRREELGRLTGFSLRALADWANDKLPSQPARRRLCEVRRLLDALAEIVEAASIPQWLHRVHPAFAPLTPLQVIELGEIDRLWAMVHDLGSGQPG